MSDDPKWTILHQDKYGDWLDQRDDTFYELVPLGVSIGNKKTPNGVFATWSLGVSTNRDPWVWGYSKESVVGNAGILASNTNEAIKSMSGDVSLMDFDSKRFSWSAAMKTRAKREQPVSFKSSEAITGMYRPFSKQWLSFSTDLIERPSIMPSLFPMRDDNELFPNLVIAASSGAHHSQLISANICDLHFSGDSQCFPLYWYEKEEGKTLFPAEGEKVVRDAWGNRYIRHDAITSAALAVFREAYPGAFHDRPLREGPKELTREDVFYYVYGILHSPEYRERFATNLQKELPRIPLAEDFEAFSRAGRALADLHLNYESIEPWAGLSCTIPAGMDPGPVTKLAWGKVRDPETKKLVADHTRMVYSKDVVVSGIPERANEYKVNGRSPLEWMIDRYKVTTDKATGIVNDPNEYSDDPRYILDLIGRLVTVSMRTLDIVDNLPPLRERGHTNNWPDAWKA